MATETGIETSPPGNIPAPISTFIGRQREIFEITQSLAGRRLLTLTGPGGCGKTRLALQVARQLHSDYPAGIWLVELGSLAEPGLVSQATATTLGLREQSGISAISMLIANLQSSQALIVLDNCEHLIEACAELTRILLENCPAMRLLATSREPLGVPGEMVRIVPPLSLADPQPWRSPGSAEVSLSAYEQSEAIQLFVDRASAASPTFTLTAQNAPWVAAICRRLDGIPLAIELAAARVRVFSPRQIAERLDDRQDYRFQLLTGGFRTAPARQQSLEAALNWSHVLLSPEEQQVFRRLAVLAGGWTMEAAGQVCSTGSDGINLIASLPNLVDKSLVVVDRHPDRTRYRYLETIRQYAWEKLVQAGEAEWIRDRHLEYFTGWAEQAEARQFGVDQPEWMEDFDAEHENLRAALQWSQTASSRVELGLRLASACAYFWKVRSYLSEGRARMGALLDQAAGSPSLARTRVLIWAANFSYLLSDFPTVKPLLDEALSLCRKLGQDAQVETARALDLLGELATEVGENEKAPPYFEEALALYQELGDQGGIADMILQLGWAAMRVGDYPQAEARLNECLLLFRKLGNDRLLGFALSGLGELSIRQGRYEQAVDLLEQSLALRREIGDRWSIAASLGSLGWAAMLQRDYERMRELLGESVALRMELGESSGMAWCLEKLAQGAAQEAQNLPTPLRIRGLRRAARLFGAAAALRQPINSTIDPADLPEYETILQSLRARLGVQDFEAAWADGDALQPAEAISKALTPLVTTAEIASMSESQAAKVKYGGLSPRERETAILIARGKTNHEIAKLMYVRVRTVETYVTRILNKLGLDSRVQIATWALESGLLEED